MAENLYVGSHKCTNKNWREGWDRTFGLKESQAHKGDPCIYCGQDHDSVEIGPCPGRTRKGGKK